MSLYSEFVDLAYKRGIGQPNQTKHMRTGQLWYHHLYEFYPHIARKVLEQGGYPYSHVNMVDPYNSDDNIPRFLEFVEAELEKEEA